MSRSHEIGSLNYRVALKFERHVGSSAAEVPVKFQRNRKNLAASIMSFTLNEKVILTTFSSLSAQKLSKWQMTVQQVMEIENFTKSLRWRHNGRDSVLNHQPYDCLLNRLFRRRWKKTPKLRVTGLCAGNSPETGEFPAQMASNAENVSIWWRHHGTFSVQCVCPRSTFERGKPEHIPPRDLDKLPPFSRHYFLSILFYENWYTFIQISLKFGPKVPIVNISALA